MDYEIMEAIQLKTWSSVPSVQYSLLFGVCKLQVQLTALTGQPGLQLQL